MRGSEIRRSFLEFFRERGHAVVASSSLVPQGDPTLLFSNIKDPGGHNILQAGPGDVVPS